MDLLSQLPSYQPDRPGCRGENAGEIRETKTGQVMTITHDDHIATYQLDVEGVERPLGDKMADGVLLAQVDDRSLVCFIELKATTKQEVKRVERAHAQLESAVEHFHPYGRSGEARSHGDDHHDAWRDHKDEVTFMPDKAHEVIEMAITFRALPRLPPMAARVVGNKKVFRAAVQVHGAQRHRVSVTLRRLLALAGVRCGKGPCSSPSAREGGPSEA